MNGVRRTIASGVVGLAGFLGGCTAQQEGDMALALLGGMAAQQGDVGAAATVEGLQRMRQAERSRSNIQQNVYVPDAQVQAQQQRYSDNSNQNLLSSWDFPNSEEMRLLIEKIPPGQHYDLFFCNKFIDLNNNGFVEPNEFFGIKKDFDITKEDIVFMYRSKPRRARDVRVKLYREDGTFLAETEANPYELRVDMFSRIRHYNNPSIANPPDVMDRLPEFGIGNYVLIATCNGNHLRRAEFTITNSPTNPN